MRRTKFSSKSSLIRALKKKETQNSELNTKIRSLREAYMRLAVENKELSRYIEILETRIKETIDDKDDCLFENWVNGD